MSASIHWCLLLVEVEDEVDSAHSIGCAKRESRPLLGRDGITNLCYD